MHGVQVSYGWVKALLQEAGLIARAKKRGQYRRRRERRALPGMLLHLDGSSHRWFQAAPDEPTQQDLIALLDDATGECLVAQFVPLATAAAALGRRHCQTAARVTLVILCTRGYRGSGTGRRFHFRRWVLHWTGHTTPRCPKRASEGLAGRLRGGTR